MIRRAAAQRDDPVLEPLFS